MTSTLIGPQDDKFVMFPDAESGICLSRRAVQRHC